MTKIRVMSFVCSCLLASYLPATSHADTMLSPSIQDGGIVNVKSDSGGYASVDVHFTSMTPIFLEIDTRDLSNYYSSWLNFNGLYNETGIPWKGIEFRVITALFVENDDNYFYFEPLTGVIENVTHSLSYVDSPYLGINEPNADDMQTITAPHMLYGEQQLYDDCLAYIQRYSPGETWDCTRPGYHYNATGLTQHVSLITFADGAPETAGFDNGEFMLNQAGWYYSGCCSYDNSMAHGKYHILITPIATSAVPVPAAVWLFASGLLGLVGVARRKNV